MSDPVTPPATQFTVTWLDFEREPQCAPDPAYPDGKDIRLELSVPSCIVALPYPARRCGIYQVRCQLCGLVAAVTTAGRPDDPRSVQIPCAPTRGTA